MRKTILTTVAVLLFTAGCAVSPSNKWIGDVNRHGQPQGYGYESRANGDQYAGEYRYGTRYGRGTYTWPNGGKYVDGWKANEMDGHGTYTWPTYTGPDRQKYVDEWREWLSQR